MVGGNNDRGEFQDFPRSRPLIPFNPRAGMHLVRAVLKVGLGPGYRSKAVVYAEMEVCLLWIMLTYTRDIHLFWVQGHMSSRSGAMSPDKC